MKPVEHCYRFVNLIGQCTKYKLKRMMKRMGEKMGACKNVNDRLQSSLYRGSFIRDHDYFDWTRATDYHNDYHDYWVDRWTDG